MRSSLLAGGIELLSLAPRPIEAEAVITSKSLSAGTLLASFLSRQTLTECPMEINLSFSEIMD
jgi:hypothetical protein